MMSMKASVESTKRYVWGSEASECDMLHYTCDINPIESASWIRIMYRGHSLMTPFSFSSCYEQECMGSRGMAVAQVSVRQLPTHTTGAIQYVSLDVTSNSSIAHISALNLHPHRESLQSNKIPVNCSGLRLPKTHIFTTEPHPSLDINSMILQLTSTLAELQLSNCEPLATTKKMRMNTSLLRGEIQPMELSVITTDRGTIKQTILPALCNFVVCVSNRVWLEQGGDPDFVMCTLNQTCVEQLNRIFPLLTVCKTLDGCDKLHTELLALMQLSIGGNVLGKKGKVVLVHRDDICVFSPVVLIRKPSTGCVSNTGQLCCETTMLVLDIRTETELLENPSMLGDMLLASPSGDNSVSLHNLTLSDGLLRHGDLCQPIQNANGRTMAADSKLPVEHTLLQIHALNDTVCAIDRRNSNLMVYQTMGDTYQTHAKLDDASSSHIRKTLETLRSHFVAFNAFNQLIRPTDTTYALPLVDDDIDSIIRSMPMAFTRCDSASPPLSTVGSQIYKQLKEANSAFRAACLPYTAATFSSTAHLAPLRHSTELGRIHRLQIIASGSCNSPTTNRAVVLVQTVSPADVCVLFIDKHLGTDPEYFSSDMRMNTNALRSASSVKNALGIKNVLYVQSMRRFSSRSTRTFTNQYGNVDHGKMHVLFAIKWKSDALSERWNDTIFSVFVANRTRDNQIGRMKAIPDEDDKIHTTFNTDWGIRVLRTSY